MFNKMFESTTVPILQEVVQFTQARHNVLAGNIANLNVPGYKSRDLSVEDFQTRLKHAVEEQKRPPIVQSPGQAYHKHAEPIAEVAKNSKTVMRHDLNNVGMEQQSADVMKNQIEHNTALALLIQQFQQMNAAISGRV
jgi:flagellar basal-body rod protein FlgB